MANGLAVHADGRRWMNDPFSGPPMQRRLTAHRPVSKKRKHPPDARSSQSRSSGALLRILRRRAWLAPRLDTASDNPQKGTLDARASWRLQCAH